MLEAITLENCDHEAKNALEFLQLLSLKAFQTLPKLPPWIIILGCLARIAPREYAVLFAALKRTNYSFMFFSAVQLYIQMSGEILVLDYKFISSVCEVSIPLLGLYCEDYIITKTSKVKICLSKKM